MGERKRVARSTWMGFVAMVVASGCADTTRTEFVGDVEVTTIRKAYSNVHQIRVDDRVVVFDTALERDAQDVFDSLAFDEEEGWDAIVISHGHADHAGGARSFRERTGAPIVMGAGDRFMVDEGRNDTLCPTDGTAERRLEESQAETYTPFEPDVGLEPDTSAELGELLGWDDPLGTLHAVPGHTPGSVVLVVGEAVFVGDLFRGSVLGSSARTHYYQCDLADNQADLRFVLDDVAPEGRRFFLGHFGPVDREALEALASPD